MSTFDKLTGPKIEGFSAVAQGPHTVSLAGVLSIPDPRETVGVYFEALHKAALADRLTTVELDVRELTFVNSSAIRLFVDWTSRVAAEAPERRYKVHFLISRRITWQRTSFNVLRSLTPNVVELTAE